MRFIATRCVFAIAVLGALIISGCAGGKSCEALCKEAQAGSCTAITGNCGSFCTSLDAVEGPANCGSQRDAYQDCLNKGASVCSNDCDSQENALSTCLGRYCLGHMSDADCITLNNSF